MFECWNIPGRGSNHPRWRTLWAAVIPFAAFSILTVLAYLPGMHGPLVFDDVTNIVEDKALYLLGFSWDHLLHAMLSSDAGPFRRPLSALSFALNIYFFGLDPFAFKLVNVIIHLLNGFLFYWLLRQMCRHWREKKIIASASAADWLPLVGTATWMLHPLNLTAVLYVVQRETSLCSFFILLGCALYTRGRLRMLAGKSGWLSLYIITAASGVLAIVSKETGLLLPVYLLVIEICVLQFDTGSYRKRGLLIFYATFLLFPFVLGLIWLFAIHRGAFLSYAGRNFTLTERLLTEPRVIWDYIRWTLFPRLPDLGLYHDDIPLSSGLLSPPTTLLSILGLGALIVTAGLAWRRHPWIAFGILWFLTGQLLESTVFPLEIAFEHRNYLADMGILMVLSGFILTEPSRLLKMRVRLGILVLLTLTYGTVTAMRAYVWRSTLSLVTVQASNHPDSPYATYALGQELTNLVLAGDKRLLPRAEAALAHSASLPASGIIPDAALALLESQVTGNNDPANFSRMAERLRTRAISSSDQQGLASLVQCEGAENCHFPYSAMQSLFDAALANPHLRDSPDTYANILTDYGNYLAHGPHEDLMKSRALMQQAAEAVPSVSQYRVNVVILDIALQDPALAERDLQAVMALNKLGNLSPVIEDLQKRIVELKKAPELPSKSISAVRGTHPSVPH
jgi:protein O-mannosyl-transferase